MGGQDLVVIVDIGHTVTELAFYDRGRLSFLRKIAFGGNLLTQALTQPLMTEKGQVALTQEEAESVKCAEELLGNDNSKLAAGKIEISKLYALIRPELEKLTAELERSLDYYAQEQGVHAGRIFLTGGASRLKGLAQFLEANVGVSVQPVDLTRRLRILGTTAAQGLDSYYRLISVVLDRAYTEADPWRTIRNSLDPILRSISYTQAAVAVLVVSTVLAGGMLWRYVDIVQKTRDVQRQIVNLKAGFSESQKIQDLERQINQGAILASAVLENEPYWDEVFRELAHVFPDHVLLTEIGYEDQGFMLKGTMSQTAGEASVSKLLMALEGSIFQKATLVNTAKSGDAVLFTIRAKTGKR